MVYINIYISNDIVIGDNQNVSDINQRQHTSHHEALLWRKWIILVIIIITINIDTIHYFTTLTVDIRLHAKMT